MLLKIGVISEGVQSPTWYALGVFEAVYYRYGYELTVTALLDGDHMTGSKHYEGLAADLRSNGIPGGIVDLIVNDSKNLLFHLGYDIKLEDDHIHMEFDPKPGRSEWLLKHA